MYEGDRVYICYRLKLYLYYIIYIEVHAILERQMHSKRITTME